MQTFSTGCVGLWTRIADATDSSSCASSSLQVGPTHLQIFLEVTFWLSRHRSNGICSLLLAEVQYGIVWLATRRLKPRARCSRPISQSFLSSRFYHNWFPLSPLSFNLHSWASQKLTMASPPNDRRIPNESRELEVMIKAARATGLVCLYEKYQ